MVLEAIEMMEIAMPAIDDLKAAIADLKVQITEGNNDIEELLTKITTPGTSDADIASAVADIRTIIAGNKTETDKVAAAFPPASPTPTPGP